MRILPALTLEARCNTKANKGGPNTQDTQFKNSLNFSPFYSAQVIRAPIQAWCQEGTIRYPQAYPKQGTSSCSPVSLVSELLLITYMHKHTVTKKYRPSKLGAQESIYQMSKNSVPHKTEPWKLSHQETKRDFSITPGLWLKKATVVVNSRKWE